MLGFFAWGKRDSLLLFVIVTKTTTTVVSPVTPAVIVHGNCGCNNIIAHVFWDPITERLIFALGISSDKYIHISVSTSSSRCCPIRYVLHLLVIVYLAVRLEVVVHFWVECSCIGSFTERSLELESIEILEFIDCHSELTQSWSSTTWLLSLSVTYVPGRTETNTTFQKLSLLPFSW